MDDARTDDEVEARLRRALDDEVRGHGPDPGRVDALRALAAARAGQAQAQAQATSVSARRHGRAPMAIAAAAAVVAFVAGALVAARPPDAVRDAAVAIGFDIDSSDLVEARNRMDALGRTLASATTARVDGELTDAELAAVADADARMLEVISSLNDGERDEIVPIAHQVHLRAVELFVAEGRSLATAQPTDLAEIDRGS